MPAPSSTPRTDALEERCLRAVQIFDAQSAEQKSANLALLIRDVCEEMLGEARALERQLAAAEAKIDALMFEYCPYEMTPDQIENWAKHQKPVPQLVCEKCGADRYKEPCGANNPLDCPLGGKALSGREEEER